MSNILILIDSNALHTGTVRDHLDALTRLSRHCVYLADCRGAIYDKVSFDRFDVLVFHYSVVIANSDFISNRLAEQCAAFRGLKVLFIQDEYRWIDATTTAAAKLGVGVIFTVVNKSVIPVIYGHPALAGVRTEQTLTGFVPEQLLQRPVARFDRRPVDVGYRGRSLPYWLGAFAQDKWKIGARFAREAPLYGLKVDIAFDEGARLYRGAWIRFLARCKAVLGTESGASICDFNGDIQRKVETYVAEHPHACFEEVSARFLSDIDGRHLINVISPRCFEAAAMRTLMILYPGDYSGILEPGRHYVPLAKDHSNMDEVVAVLQSPDRAQEVINAAYHEVACNPANTFRTFILHFDRVVTEEALRRRGPVAPALEGLRYRLIWELYKSAAFFKVRSWTIRVAAAMRPYLPAWLWRALRHSAVRMGLA